VILLQNPPVLVYCTMKNLATLVLTIVLKLENLGRLWTFWGSHCEHPFVFFLLPCTYIGRHQIMACHRRRITLKQKNILPIWTMMPCTEKTTHWFALVYVCIVYTGYI
jgi:hypothetical protein